MMWIDWAFSPLEWFSTTIDSRLDLSLSPGVAGTLGLFLAASFSTLLAFALLGFCAYLLLRAADSSIKKAFRWSVAGSDLNAYQQATTQYEAVSWMLARARSWTGVTTGHRSDPPQPLPRPTESRLYRTVTRGLLSLPQFFVALLKFAWAWTRHPIGAYLLLGSIWVQNNPDLNPALQGSRGLLTFVATPQGLAVLTVLIAVTTIALDHGITPRVRGRNTFQQQQSSLAEETLTKARVAAETLAADIEVALADIVQAHESVISSAAEFATQGRFTVHGGEVHAVPAKSRRTSDWLYDIGNGGMPGYGPNWDTPEPLISYRSGPNEWDPGDPVENTLLSLAKLVQDHENAGALRAQTPRSGRFFLSQCNLEKLDGTILVPFGATVLCRERLEQRGLDLIKGYQLVPVTDGEDSDRDLERLTRFVNRAFDDVEDDTWEASLLQARAERFASAIWAWQSPSGWRRFFGQRF